MEPFKSVQGALGRLKSGLSKTSRQIGAALASFTGANDDFFDLLEETLILADVGAQLATCAVDELKETVIKDGLKGIFEIKKALARILSDKLTHSAALKLETAPSVILIVGVNGVGKTTTAGKLAARFASSGKSVLLCAGDTFRAAAGEQLSLWATRSGADIIRREEGSDPASVIFDAICAAKARKTDILICDTAGRLHNKSNLMNELRKICRIINRELPEADLEILLVVDAATGQNGLRQALLFKEAADITGIILTKLDGTAKGGIVYAIAAEIDVPVKLIGIGEKVTDLMDFNAGDFTEAILS
ncbi:MAG: signal recognition particle-docking protein FtsY [Oscillospiraceae bacterium]|nr:signal recognition particle-docking protein FtsY [Oscillospiraceae bacterium]